MPSCRLRFESSRASGPVLAECPAGTAIYIRGCVDGHWTLWSDCIDSGESSYGECVPDEFEIEPCAEECMITARVCGPDGYWSTWTGCFYDEMCGSTACYEGDAQYEDCGECGVTMRFCEGGYWSAWSECEEQRDCTGL